MMTFEILFWLAFVLIFYAYFGYPTLLLFLTLLKNRVDEKGDIKPNVSFVITAYNEENQIKDKIENTLKQNYPNDRLEIIIASDCSNDMTDDIVKSYQSRGLKLVRAPERIGKENAQKYALDAATGEIFIFSDVATVLNPNGVSNIVRNFNDPTVGCVSSVDKFIDKDGKISGEGAYVKYEMLLRDLETKVNSLVSLSGSFFAARREVCKNWAVDLQSDFNTLLNSVKKGLRGVSDPESIGYYTNIANERKEFDRKVRTVLRGISVFMKSLSVLNPLKYGLFSWQLFSHKMCRWLVPFGMILAFVSNAFLISYSTFYLYVFILQFVFYGFALAGIGLRFFSSNSLLNIPSFFVLVNLSILSAWYRYFKGERMVRWEPSKR